MAIAQELRKLALASHCTNPEALNQLLENAQIKRPLVSKILEEKIVEEEAFLQGLAQLLGLPWWHNVSFILTTSLRENFPAKIALKHQILLIGESGDEIHLATSDPLNSVARRQALRAVGNKKVQWHVGPRRSILQALRQGYGVGAETFEQILQGREIDDALQEIRQEVNVLDHEDPEASVVKFVNQIFKEALAERATDVHVEPLENDLRIRYRIDGVLHEVPVPSQIKVLQASVLSRLKIMAHLDIAERRLPQDGRINLELEGRPIDVRVATIPSVTGESVSLRLLGQERFDFERLGLDAKIKQTIRSLLAMPNGIVLVTGPTGCGKSTSLYTFLSSLNTQERRIVTIEEPVEHKLDGVIQIPVRPEIGLTFATGLRSILRGDPNVIMVGEMRDFETAEIAVRAALTGHLVFSTLHTNDAVGGITRLVDMGVEPFLVGSAVRAFIAQRLVRVLCQHCRQPASHSREYLQQIGYPADRGETMYKATGCEHCRHTGYTGRAALYEICLVTERIADLITQRKEASVLRATALEEGMIPLRQYGFMKVSQGMTTIEEVVRVTTAEASILDE